MDDLSRSFTMADYSISRILSTLLAVVMLGASLPAPVAARMIGSEETISASRSGADRAAVEGWLGRSEVREQMLAMGVDPAEVDARVAALGDAEIAELAGRMDTMPVGSASVVGVLFTVFIILLVTDILGLTKVFPFTRAVR
jgi:hypothetical protein